jgi:Mg2+ and Co2+ transporter CorA
MKHTMNRSILLIAMPLLLLFGCNTVSSEATETEELESHVMAIHDEAMAKMGDIYKLRRNLRSLRDTLATQQTDTATLQALQQQIDGLNAADEVMMVWMRNYQAPDSVQQDQAMNYLQQELQKIERVQTVMDSTITAARQTYQQYEQQK